MQEIGRYRCAECGAEFDSREQLTMHQRRVRHGEEQPADPLEWSAGDLRCGQCGQVFGRRQELEQHLRHAH